VKDALGDVQSVLVLGGTSEIAQAIARKLVARRCRTVVLAARRPDDCASFAAEMRRLGATVDTVGFDASHTDDHATVVGEVFDRHGDIDVVVMAFGVLGDQATFEQQPELAVDAAMTNYVGAVSAGLVVANRLKRQGHGTLVVLSSVAGERARKANFVYGSTKAGLDAFAQGLGDSLVGSGVQVVVVRPGFVKTKMTEGLPVPPIAATAGDVADATVKALTSGKETVWVPGTMRWVMSGLRHLPRFAWRRVPF
jgi:decaprenylphospho-beta-D-erythro-pentofuranosid-2-ulose 2-reductase